VKIDREVVTVRAELAAEREVRGEPARPVEPLRNQDAIEMGIVHDDRRRGRLDDVGEVGVWKRPPQGMNGRGREDDVADLAQADEKNPGDLGS
jgi:hypothetical protein